jgi:hypothetical protein
MQCEVSVASVTHSVQPVAFLNKTVTAKWHAISTTVRVVGTSAHLHWAVTLSPSTAHLYPSLVVWPLYSLMCR